MTWSDLLDTKLLQKTWKYVFECEWWTCWDWGYWTIYSTLLKQRQYRCWPVLTGILCGCVFYLDSPYDISWVFFIRSLSDRQVEGSTVSEKGNATDRVTLMWVTTQFYNLQLHLDLFFTFVTIRNIQCCFYYYNWKIIYIYNICIIII